MKQKLINILFSIVFYAALIFIVYRVYIEAGIVTAGLATIVVLNIWYKKAVIREVYRLAEKRANHE